MNNQFKIIFLTLAAFLVACSFDSVGQRRSIQPDTVSDSLSLVASIDNFIDAFTNLKWKEFTACFAEESTAFFPPSAKFPYRANNKKEVENIFKQVFENARKRKSNPPYLDIQPRELKIQITYSTAIVTFLLEDPDLLGRRTIVLKKESSRWLIVHLHASGVIVPETR